MGNKYNAARPKKLGQKKAKGNKKSNKYLPTTLHLSIFPLRTKKQNKSKQKTSFFFVITQKNQSPFFCNIFKEKKRKASFKNLCHSIPKRFDLNTTVPLYEYLPSLYTVHRMGQRNWSSLEYSNIYVPNGTFHVFYCTFCTFPIKTFYVSIAFSCHKIIFFLLALVK